MVSRTTQVAAVIGRPIVQVKSPDNLNRYFIEQHMDSVVVLVDIAPDTIADYLSALHGWQNMTGVLMMVPRKQRAAALVDELTPHTRRLNTINVIRELADGCLQDDMLNGVSFQPVAEAQGFQPASKQALFSGCGGVGSVIAWEPCEAGIRQLTLYDRNPTIRQRLHDLLAEAFPAVQLNAPSDTLHGVDPLVNDSPVGMAGSDELPLLQVLLDTPDSVTHVTGVVTASVMIPLPTFAAVRGCRMQTGPETVPAQMTLMGQLIDAIPPAQRAAA